MKLITGLRAAPLQVFTAADPNTGNPISFSLSYKPRVESWFIDITFGTFVLKGFRLTRSPNILMAYVNLIPFGLGLVISDELDPFLVNDFTSGRVSMYLLLSSEVAEIQALIAAGTITG